MEELSGTIGQTVPRIYDSELWEQLGASLKRRTNPKALDAYLEANGSQGHVPTAESATAIGQLFLKLNNLSQAEDGSPLPQKATT